MRCLNSVQDLKHEDLGICIIENMLHLDCGDLYNAETLTCFPSTESPLY